MSPPVAFESIPHITVWLLNGVAHSLLVDPILAVKSPGLLAIVTDVTEFHQMIAAFKSLDEAQAEQTPPSDVRPARVTDPAPASGTDPK